MTKKYKTILALIIVAVLGSIIFWKRDYLKQKMGLESDTNLNNNNLPSENQKITYKECNTFPLKKGCKGKYILTIQKALNKIYNSNLKEDGYFGPKTESALIENGYGATVELEDIQNMKQLL